MNNIKYENEITVEITTSYEELKQILEDQGFNLIEEYELIDTYMLSDKCQSSNALEMLKHCILLRNIITETKNLKYILYKYKEYNDKKEIVNQGKVHCKVDSLDEARELLEVMGYNYLIKIVDHIKVFSNEKTELAVQLVNDKHIYLELEDNGEYGSIEELKKELDSYNLPIKGGNYFVKKAEIEIIESNQ